MEVSKNGVNNSGAEYKWLFNMLFILKTGDNIKNFIP